MSARAVGALSAAALAPVSRADGGRFASAAVPALATAFAPVSLEDLNARAALQTRLDQKYLVTIEDFARLVDLLAPSYLALEIDGRRCFSYDTVYFDGDGLPSYHGHVQRRRRRFKARSRRYLDSALCLLEVKLKGRRGETLKPKMNWEPALHGRMTPVGQAFVARCLEEAYGQQLASPLRPALHNEYRRLTLTHGQLPERVTCDFDLMLGWKGQAGRMQTDLVLVESKSHNGRGSADAALRQLGVRPISASKYCLGIALTRPHVRSNDLRRVLTRAFQPIAAASPRHTTAVGFATA